MDWTRSHGFNWNKASLLNNTLPFLQWVYCPLWHTCPLISSFSFLIWILHCRAHLLFCLSLCVCHLSFSLILWWKQLCVECFIPRESGNHVTRWLTICSPRAPDTGVSLYLALSVSMFLSVIFVAQTTYSQTFIPSLSLPHLISLHPILCVWTEGGDSVQARLLLWRLQHHLSLCGEWGHPWQPAHRWWYSHHRPNGKTVIAVKYWHSDIRWHPFNVV